LLTELLQNVLLLPPWLLRLNRLDGCRLLRLTLFHGCRLLRLIRLDDCRLLRLIRLDDCRLLRLIRLDGCRLLRLLNALELLLLPACRLARLVLHGRFRLLDFRVLLRVLDLFLLLDFRVLLRVLDLFLLLRPGRLCPRLRLLLASFGRARLRVPSLSEEPESGRPRACLSRALASLGREQNRRAKQHEKEPHHHPSSTRSHASR
jgi:hypothetical protein